MPQGRLRQQRAAEPSGGRGAAPPGAELVPEAAAVPGRGALCGALPASDNLKQMPPTRGRSKAGRRLSIAERDLWV